ncbi:MAG: ABC transporter ATP-binding protein [Xanthomonadales bacterium]|nr:ABC transporter ATP-binding protein [Xanthomonadales bacterium]
MSESPALSLRGVGQHYGQGAATVPVLDDVDLEVERGEAIAVLGRSGSGKTTLLQVASGLLPADQGDVAIAGTALDRGSAAQRAQVRRRRIGVVFQQFNLIPTLTVMENLEFPPALAGRPVDRRELIDWLARLGLEKLADRFPEQLSGGEQQRVAVLRALVHEPDLVLADEPTANLDLENAQRVIELLHEQSRQRGAALVLVTHSSDLTVPMERILRIENRRLLQVQ